MEPAPDLRTLRSHIIRHVLRDGTHEIRAGLMVAAPAGCWLVFLCGFHGAAAGLALLLGVMLLAFAGPGVSRLRARLVFPRLGYARHTESTDLVALAGVGVVALSALSAWLDATGQLMWGSALPAIALPLALGILAGNSSLGRHYLMALLLAVAGVVLLVRRPAPFVLLATMLLVTGALLTIGGALALRSLVANHEPVEESDGRE